LSRNKKCSSWTHEIIGERSRSFFLTRFLFPGRVSKSLESTVRYLGIEVDDALEIAEQAELQ
ncbi:MAG TPA: hypothetical protein VF427_07635, partial [Noviherbaspirillum sp.]